MLYGCRAVTSTPVSFTWVEGKVVTQTVNPMGLFPWVDAKSAIQGASHFRRDKAFAAGLTFRPFAETARDTLTWFKTLPAERQAKMVGGLSTEQEAKILAAWKAKAQ
jgi:2'-hydroxyisoflavone reductase